MPIGKARFTSGIVIRLLRSWSAGRAAGRDQLAMMKRITDPLGLPETTAMSCASLFELVEGRLGRALEPACFCSQALSPDETGLIGILATAPMRAPHQDDDTDKGWPSSAIFWAVVMVREAFGLTYENFHPGAEEAHAPRTFSSDSPRKQVRHGV